MNLCIFHYFSLQFPIFVPEFDKFWKYVRYGKYDICYSFGKVVFGE